VSKGSRALLLSTSIAVSVGLVSAAAAQSQQQQQQPQQQFQQQPQQQQPQQQQSQQQPQPQQQPQQSQQQDLQQIWQMHQAQMRARIAGAVQQLRQACQDELRNFCGTVTPGEGRLLLCMQAHEDKISRQCELALMETSRNIGKAVRRVENIAQACWQDIQTHCSGTGGSVMQCMMDNRASLSAPCQAMVVAALPSARQSQGPQDQQSMVGVAIYSADGMMLGQVTGVRRRPDGSLEAIEADLGSPMGMGAISVLISPSDLRWKGDGVELQMVADQVRTILQGQRQ
jgi:cysteine rich repeat protein